jgi:hypothetical protein
VETTDITDLPAYCSEGLRGSAPNHVGSSQGLKRWRVAAWRLTLKFRRGRRNLVRYDVIGAPSLQKDPSGTLDRLQEPMTASSLLASCDARPADSRELVILIMYSTHFQHEQSPQEDSTTLLGLQEQYSVWIVHLYVDCRRRRRQRMGGKMQVIRLGGCASEKLYSSNVPSISRTNKPCRDISSCSQSIVWPLG